jgi:hypothetical protein
MKTLLTALLLAGLAACSHTVYGTGAEESASSTEPLPGAGEGCECKSTSVGVEPPTDCCQDGLVCGAGFVTCSTAGCARQGTCVSPK